MEKVTVLDAASGEEIGEVPESLGTDEMVLCDNILVREKLSVASPPEDDPYASFEGRLGAQLWAVSAADGKKLAEYPLDALPVFDGLIAADGNLYLSSQDGKLTCFAAVQ
jgi:outer membrane protein assembly factor BamB